MFTLKNNVVISLNEKVNFEVADKCSKLNLKQFKVLFNKSTTKRHDDYNLIGEYKKLINYCNAILESKNNNKVEYGFSKYKDIGRLQSKNPSIQRIYNGFRGILCNDIMIDYDMKNCHVVLLLNLCKKHNLKYNKLLYYIENREECLNELMNNYNLNRGQAKGEYLKLINKAEITGKINNKKIKKNSFILEFDEQVTEIIKSLYKIYKKDEKYKKYKVSEWNKEGKLMNLVLCDLENKYLNEAINELVNNNIMKKEDIAVLMFDGFMSYNKNRDDVIKFLNSHFKNDGIEWDYKDHNIELLEELNNMELKRPKDYQTVKKDFDKNHFVIEHPLMYGRIYEINNKKQYALYNKFDFKDLTKKDNENINI